MILIYVHPHESLRSEALSSHQGRATSTGRVKDFSQVINEHLEEMLQHGLRLC